MLVRGCRSSFLVDFEARRAGGGWRCDSELRRLGVGVVEEWEGVEDLGRRIAVVGGSMVIVAVVVGIGRQDRTAVVVGRGRMAVFGAGIGRSVAVDMAGIVGLGSERLLGRCLMRWGV